MQDTASPATAAPPQHLLCPISGQLFDDPVIVVESGQTYERSSILEWLQQQGKAADFVTGQPLSSDALVPNLAVKRMVLTWKNKNHADTVSSNLQQQKQQQQQRQPQLPLMAQQLQQQMVQDQLAQDQGLTNQLQQLHLRSLQQQYQQEHQRNLFPRAAAAARAAPQPAAAGSLLSVVPTGPPAAAAATASPATSTAGGSADAAAGHAHTSRVLHTLAVNPGHHPATGFGPASPSLAATLNPAAGLGGPDTASSSRSSSHINLAGLPNSAAAATPGSVSQQQQQQQVTMTGLLDTLDNVKAARRNMVKSSMNDDQKREHTLLEAQQLGRQLVVRSRAQQDALLNAQAAQRAQQTEQAVMAEAEARVAAGRCSNTVIIRRTDPPDADCVSSDAPGSVVCAAVAADGGLAGSFDGQQHEGAQPQPPPPPPQQQQAASPTMQPDVLTHVNNPAGGATLNSSSSSCTLSQQVDQGAFLGQQVMVHTAALDMQIRQASFAQSSVLQAADDDVEVTPLLSQSQAARIQQYRAQQTALVLEQQQQQQQQQHLLPTQVVGHSSSISPHQQQQHPRQQLQQQQQQGIFIHDSLVNQSTHQAGTPARPRSTAAAVPGVAHSAAGSAAAAAGGSGGGGPSAAAAARGRSIAASEHGGSVTSSKQSKKGSGGLFKLVAAAKYMVAFDPDKV